MAAREQHDVVVVGAGPNGLAGAVTMARAGLDVLVLEAQPTIGGGARTVDLGLGDGLVHDLCSAVHPMAVASPFFRQFDLAARGVQLTVPEISYAQPLDDGRAGLAYRDLDRTVAELGPDGAAWRALLGPLVREPETVTAVALGDKRSVPREALRPRGALTAATFGAAVLEQGTRAWNARFRGDVAPALLTGVAAHAISPLPSLAASGTSVLLAALAHGVGWPIPTGGSQAVVDALVADLRAHGGQVRAEAPVRHWRELPRARAYLFDTTPRALVQIWGERMRPSVRAGLERFRYGNAAAKVDLVLSGPVPWAVPEVGRAGTVHVGGSREQVAQAENEVAAGRHAESPLMLLSDPTLHDPTRRHGDLRPLWTYAHVPAGSTVDVTDTVIAQVERFAPGFRDVVVAARCIPAAQMSHHNANYIDGDIAAGRVSMWQMFARPRPAWDPFAGGVPGVYLCSQATTPGPGVHGVGGWSAALRALRDRFGIRTGPDLSPRGGPQQSARG